MSNIYEQEKILDMQKTYNDLINKLDQKIYLCEFLAQKQQNEKIQRSSTGLNPDIQGVTEKVLQDLTAYSRDLQQQNHEFTTSAFFNEQNKPYYEWPLKEDEPYECQRKLMAVEYEYDKSAATMKRLRLHFTDGSQSPIFGMQLDDPTFHDRFDFPINK